MISQNLSHVYIPKKTLLVSLKFWQIGAGSLKLGRLAKDRLVMGFFYIKNGSNLERSLLSIIQSYDVNGSKLKIFFYHVNEYEIKML